MVWSKGAPPAPAWAIALEAKPKQTSDMQMASVLGEVVIQISECLQFVPTLIRTSRAFYIVWVHCVHEKPPFAVVSRAIQK
jgi:hypothetical protein